MREENPWSQDTARCPQAFALSPEGWFAGPVVCIWVNSQMMKKWPYTVPVSDHGGTRRRSVAWTRPQDAVSVPGTLRHSLCPYRWAQIVSQGNGDGAGWGLRKGKSQGSRGGNIHSGGRAVCQEENAGTKLPSMFVLEWGSDIQTEHCLFARTHVKGLFVPSWNPGGVCLS